MIGTYFYLLDVSAALPQTHTRTQLCIFESLAEAKLSNFCQLFDHADWSDYSGQSICQNQWNQKKKKRLIGLTFLTKNSGYYYDLDKLGSKSDNKSL
jgi:hypothetical protein